MRQTEAKIGQLDNQARLVVSHAKAVGATQMQPALSVEALYALTRADAQIAAASFSNENYAVFSKKFSMVCDAKVKAESAESSLEVSNETVSEEMKKAFRPEFLNRIDETIVFAHLSQDEIRQIVDLMLKDLFKRLAEHGLSVEVTDEVKDHLAKNGYSEAYGARPLRRLIQRKIEDNLAEEILSGKYATGDTIRITLVDDKIAFEKASKRRTKSKEEKEEKPEEVSQ